MARLIATARIAAAFALAAAPAAAQGPMVEGASVTGLELVRHTGTTVMQNMRSESSRIGSDGVSIVAETVEILFRDPESGVEIEATCPLSRYFFASPDPPEIAPRISIGDLQTLQRLFSLPDPEPDVTDPREGDILLADPNAQMGVEVDLGAQGELLTVAMWWSEKYQRYLSLGSFVQRTETEEGTLSVRGEAFIADRSFSEWEYPVLGNEPLELEFTVGSE